MAAKKEQKGRYFIIDTYGGIDGPYDSEAEALRSIEPHELDGGDCFFLCKEVAKLERKTEITVTKLA